ncbi:MAG: GNAT family N-acetyltransferase [Candidatus Eremiobacteraeota bacterium]|nr:GNAT family N-acetyltransferase [Candidatus Eremiobacteraeota bacterium]
MSCRLASTRVIVRLPEQRDAQAIARYFGENAQHLAVFSPAPPEYADPALWRVRIETMRRQYADGDSCLTFLFDLDDAQVIGTANLSEFVRGPFQAAYLGYSVAKAREGQGLMHEALRLLIDFAFGELRLHRIMANHMPRNERSAALLRRLGFVREGLAREYLRINGVWEDHVLTSLTNSAWRAD